MSLQPASATAAPANDTAHRSSSGTAATTWSLWSTRARLVVTRPQVVGEARALVDRYLAEVDDAANRFRSDAEISRISAAAQQAPLDTAVSPVLADLLTEALAAAELTEGDVDPTVGSALNTLGYDRDIDLVRRRDGRMSARVAPVPGHRAVRLTGDRLRLPRGVVLDLGATAKAVAADRCARLVATALDVGVLVSLGGDIATAGPGPDGDWQITVQDRPEDPADQVALPPGAAIATSSTVARRWVRDGRDLHHIVDPRTGQPAAPVWRSVTVAAASCAYANAVTTACVVRGDRAQDWVEGLGLPARFLDASGRVTTTTGWPKEAAA